MALSGVPGRLGREAQEGLSKRIQEISVNWDKVVASVVWSAGWVSTLSIQDSAFSPVIYRWRPFEGALLGRYFLLLIL